MARSDEGKGRRSGGTAGVRDDEAVAMAGISGFDPLLRASNCLLNGWMAVGSELLEFGKARLDLSIEVGRAITRSSTLNEAIDVQTRYTRSMVEDYVSEAGKIVDLGTRSLIDSLSGLNQPPSTAPTHAEAAE